MGYLNRVMTNVRKGTKRHVGASLSQKSTHKRISLLGILKTGGIGH